MDFQKKPTFIHKIQIKIRISAYLRTKDHPLTGGGRLYNKGVYIHNEPSGLPLMWSIKTNERFDWNPAFNGRLKFLFRWREIFSSSFSGASKKLVFTEA